MVKHQIHEDFKVFIGSSILELSKTVSDWVAQNKVAAKSLSVLQESNKLVVVLGFSEGETAYPVSIESVVLELPEPNTQGIEAGIEDAVDEVNGDVICHSLFTNANGEWEIAFLLHE